MTAPLIPSALTAGDPNAGQGQPFRGPIRDRAYWTSVIHNAAKVTPDQPRYGEARQVVQIALENLDNLMQRKNVAETPNPVVPGIATGAAMNALQGLTLGGGDEALAGLAGLATLLTQGGLQQASNRVQQTQEGFRDQRGAFFGQHPAIAIASDLVGTAANPLNKVLGPITEGLGPVAKGAVYGTTIGAARGFGEGVGTAKERLPSAAMGAAVGLITGSALGKAVKIIGPTIGKLAENSGLFRVARQALGPKAAPTEVVDAVEASIRNKLTKLNVAPEDVERAIQSWRQTGELSVQRLAETHPPAPPPPPTIRPGETITQVAPKGFEVTGTRATPPVPTAPTLGEMQGFPTERLGRGGTLPWYPRGGAAEQRVAPFPVTSNPPSAQPQGQIGALLEYLKQASNPQDAMTRLGTLRDLGIPTPGDPAQILSLLFGAR